MTMLITPLAAVILAGTLALSLVRSWRSLQSSEHVIGIGLVALGFGFALFVLTSPYSRLIMYWFLD